MNEFQVIKKTLSQRHELWEDPEFRAVQNSVFYHQTPPFQFQWKRPKEICSKPEFINDNLANCDIIPGKMGDCWLVSCFAVLQLNEGLFYRVVPADQSFSNEFQYAGIFRFRIWWCGEWTEVIIDDRLPTINGKLAFLHTTYSNQFWPSLLEKAYAKLHGSYEALKYGTFLDGLADLTGGISETIPIPQDLITCLRLLSNLVEITTIVTCIVQDTNIIQQTRQKAEKMFNGIEIDMNYRIYNIEKVNKYNGDINYAVKLRHPLITSHTDMNENREFNEYNTNNDFLMPLKEFIRTFTHLELIHLDMETSRDEVSLQHKKSWQMKTIHSFWQKGVTAGGCRNNIETFHINPQVHIFLTEMDEVIISLNQHSVLEPKVIGFTTYALTKNPYESFGAQFFNRNKSMFNSQYTNTRQVSQRCKLDDNNYLIIPTTFEPGQESRFTIRIFCSTNIKLKILDTQPTLLKSAIAKAPILMEGKNFSQFEMAFLQLSDEHRTINAFDLQELLEACLPNDYIRSCATLEICRQIVLTFDMSRNGRMKFKDFKDFMFSLKNWQNIFKNYTKEKAGILKAEKFREAIRDAGYLVSSEILSVLCNKYMRKDGTFRFGDFVSAILHLITAFKIFESKNVLQNGSIKLTLAEWLKLSQIS